MCKEMGGYFELETHGVGGHYHEGMIKLNSGRNALRYCIKVYGIKKVCVPYYTCPVVSDAVRSENCEIQFYDITEEFLPAKEFDDSEYILINNYFGVCDEQIKNFADKYDKLIIDNAQSFYSEPTGLASFYSPRKFFGLPDGGLLHIENNIEASLERDVSYDRMSHLLQRCDLGANFGYADFQANEQKLDGIPIREMSALTSSLMANINYERAKEIRVKNYNYLESELKDINELNLPDSVAAPMIYPLLIKNNNVRTKLLENKVYIARYWDGIESIAPSDSRAVYLSNNLLPLPIDQRYTIGDMEHIVKLIKDVLL